MSDNIDYKHPFLKPVVNYFRSKFKLEQPTGQGNVNMYLLVILIGTACFGTAAMLTSRMYKGTYII